MFHPTYQVLLWLDTNATQSEFSTGVELMDVNELIASMETAAVFRQLSKVVEKADLLRYEVFLTNPILFLKKISSQIEVAPQFIQMLQVDWVGLDWKLKSSLLRAVPMKMF